MQLVSRLNNITMNNMLTVYNNLTGGVDYNSGPYNVTFPAGVTSVAFNISVINDTILEGNESFTLTIMNSSLLSRVDLGIPDNTTVTIVDTTGEL